MLTKDELNELTERINERYAEFGKCMFPEMSPGQVRLIYAVIAEWQKPGAPIGEPDTLAEEVATVVEKAEAAHKANGNGHYLSESAVAALGPEHTVVTPLKPSPTHPWKQRIDGKPSHPLPSPDAARENVATMLAEASGGAIERLKATVGKPREVVRVEKTISPEKRTVVMPNREELIAEVQRMAMAGVMPTMKAFDDARPGNWSTAQAHLLRLRLTWTELQELAGLKPNPRKGGA